MEVIAALNKVANYNDFVLITEKITSPDSLDYCNVSLNISLLRDLRKIIEFERRASIQDLGKHFLQSNIAAFVTNVILKSKVQGMWEDICTPIVSLIQFALTQYIELLNDDFSRWWCSLRIVISSISELCLKYSSLQDLILSQLSEILLRLACIKSLPRNAVKHVIKNFNICSLNSKRQLRSKLCPSLQDYFSQIAQSIATCGDIDSQSAFFQTLLRWLVRRAEKEVRIAADRKWFSSSLFPHEARQIFVERKFENFDSDCRDFLNAVNKFSGLVTSINTVSVQIGKIKLKELENKQICLDINSGCISIYCGATSFCDPQSKNCQYAHLWETIIIMPQIVSKAVLKRESNEPVLLLYLEREPEYQLPTSKMMILENYKTLDIWFNKSEDLKRVSTALGRLLGVKFTDEGISSTMVNSTTIMYKKRSSSLSRRICRQHQSSEKKVSRVLLTNSVKGKLARRGTSPSLASSTSTTSLALLGENLRRYRQVNYDKRMDNLAQSPLLSNITEETNANALSVQSSYSNLLTKQNEITEDKSSSIQFPKCNRTNRSISPVVSSDDENFRSLCLIVEQNSFNTNTDIKQQTKIFQDDLLKEAMTQKSVAILSKLSNADVEKVSREIRPTELHNKKSELVENQKGIQKQNEYQATPEVENKTVYDSEETGSDFIVETQKQCKPVKSNVSENVKLTNPAKVLIKQADFAKNKSDDCSANDVIESTPLVNNRRLFKQKKKVNGCKTIHIPKQFGEETLDNHIVGKSIIDQFFDSHFSQANETTQVNPDKARANNETSSDSDTNEPVRLIESEVWQPSEPMEDCRGKKTIRKKYLLSESDEKCQRAKNKKYKPQRTKPSKRQKSAKIISDHKLLASKFSNFIETDAYYKEAVYKFLSDSDEFEDTKKTKNMKKKQKQNNRNRDESRKSTILTQRGRLVKACDYAERSTASSANDSSLTTSKDNSRDNSRSRFQKSLSLKHHNNVSSVEKMRKEPNSCLMKEKNMKKKQKQNNRNRDESRKSTILTQRGRLVKACDYAERSTASSANDSSLTTSKDNNSRDNSRSRFQKSLSLKHHNNVSSVKKMRKEPNSCLDAELNVMMDEVTIENKMVDDNDVIPKTLEKNISMEEPVHNEIIDNIFSKATSPELNNASCIENTEIENTVKVRPSKLHSNKSRIAIERAKAKTKNLSKNKKIFAKDLNETSESLPPLIVEVVDNERNDDKLDDIKSLTIDKIRKALKRLAETTSDDLQSDVRAMLNENMCEVVESDVFLESNGDILLEPIETSKKVNKEKEENNLPTVKTIFAVENKDENEPVNINNNNVIEDNTTVNRDLPINAENKTDSNIHKLTENIVCKDSVNNRLEIITILDSSQSTKQIMSEKLIERMTPLVNNRRLFKQKKKVNGCKTIHIPKQFGEETLDNHIVGKSIIDQFFDSHFSQANETTQVNPDKARANNETSSDSDTTEPVRLIESEVWQPSEPMEDCRGKKTIRKKYLLSESDEKCQRAKNKKYKPQRTKPSKRQKSAKIISDHKLLASNFSNFIETDAYEDKEAVYKFLSDSDEFEDTKKTKNMKKKQKQNNRNRDESRKSTILTQRGRLVKACDYAERSTASSANDSSLTTSKDNSRDNSRSRFQKSLSLKHHNNVSSVKKMRKEPNSCLDAELNLMMDEVTIENKMVDDNDVIPKTLEKNISMEEPVHNEIIDNIFSKATSPELNNASCIENTEIENTVKVRPSKLHSNKSRIAIERAKAKTKNLSKNKKIFAKDLNETSESLPPLIVEVVDNERNDDKLDDIKSLTIDKIRKALKRLAETTSDDLQSDVRAMLNENMCEVVESDVFLESNGDILLEPIETSKKVNKEKEENNLPTVKTIFAVENKDENEPVNINNNNVIEDNTTVNRDLPINAENKTDSNIHKLTENIVCKDSVNNRLEIITILDSSQSTKQIMSEKQIEQCDDINVSIPTSVIYISDRETTPTNQVADVSLNTIGESPIRAHVDTTNDLPVTLEDLQRTLSPRQFSDRSIHASPEQVLGKRTKKYINTRRFFSKCNLWSDSSDSSEGDFRMYMNKKPRLSTPENDNQCITMFCNTPENFHRHNSTELTENSSGLLFNLSALTAHISPIKCNFSRNDKKNQKTQNDIFNVQEEHQVISKNKLATPPLKKEITLDNSTNDLLYKTTDGHISPIKLAPFLHSDTDMSSESDSNLSPTIHRKGKIITLFNSDSERNVAAACSVANSKVNNLREIQLSPEDDEKSDGHTSDTDLSMHSEPRRESSLQPDLCRFDLKSRWNSLETQLAHISETDIQLEYKFSALEDCLRDVNNLREQKKLQWNSLQTQLAHISETDIQLEYKFSALEDCLRDVNNLREQKKLQNAQLKEDIKK